MNDSEINNDLIAFWNRNFEKLVPQKIESSEFPDDKLSGYFKLIGDRCENVLDIGMGSGYGIIIATMFGSKVKTAIGIDPSENAVNYVKKVSELSGLNQISCFLGDHSKLSQWPDETFDGIICSNVLDVVPANTSANIVKEILRLLKPGGWFLMKINFYLTKELIQKLNMTEIEKNSYAINGIMRGLNRSTEEWKKTFAEFVVSDEDEYERIQNGPKGLYLLKTDRK